MSFEDKVNQIGKSGSKYTEKLLDRMNKMSVSKLDENRYYIEIIGGSVYKKTTVIYKMAVNKRELIRTANSLCEKYRVVKQNVTVKNDIEETKADK